jgi:hypothetical protein
MRIRLKWLLLVHLFSSIFLTSCQENSSLSDSSPYQGFPKKEAVTDSIFWSPTDRLDIPAPISGSPVEYEWEELIKKRATHTYRAN